METDTEKSIYCSLTKFVNSIKALGSKYIVFFIAYLVTILKDLLLPNLKLED
jgi:hypothetical protein